MNPRQFFSESAPAEPAGGCGDCQVCCVVLGVESIDKPAHKSCKHQCSSGCGIYPERPAECRDYLCLWRAGVLIGGVNYRPDRLGLMLTVHNDESMYDDAILIYEAWPGASDSPRARYFLGKIGAVVPFVLMIGPGHYKFGGPPHICRANARKMMDRIGRAADDAGIGVDFQVKGTT
jgi:hypothetical protein